MGPPHTFPRRGETPEAVTTGSGGRCGSIGMRIGTWDLEGRWTPEHGDVLLQQECDLWLLTEVAAGTRLPGYAAVTTEADMLPGKAWAAVLSRRALTPGGDFNHALEGPEVAGSAGGAARLLDLLRQRDSVARTIGCAHRLPDVKTIDHVAVPAGWTVTQVCHHGMAGLSDHDLYLVEVVRG